MNCRYAVTFEFTTEAPLTVRGVIEANALRTIVARAIDDATDKNPGIKWTSISVLIDRT